jgi:hypothetical protein
MQAEETLKMGHSKSQIGFHLHRKPVLKTVLGDDNVRIMKGSMYFGM